MPGFTLPLTVLVGLAAAGSWVAVLAVPSSASTTASSSTPEPAGAAVSPGISIDEARHSDETGPLLVNGYLVLRTGHPAQLCDALTRARPPRCKAARLTVRGLPSPEKDSLAAEGRGTRTRWSPEPVHILGTVKGTTLRVDATAKA